MSILLSVSKPVLLKSLLKSSAATKKSGLDLEAVTIQTKLGGGFLTSQLEEERAGEQRPRGPFQV